MWECQLSLIIALIFEPILILGVAFLLFVKRIRRYFILTFFVVAALHIAFFMFLPTKDNNWFNSLLMRVAVDAVILLSLGYFVRPIVSSRDSEKEENKE